MCQFQQILRLRALMMSQVSRIHAVETGKSVVYLDKVQYIVL